jgi:hypothetical protein
LSCFDGTNETGYSYYDGFLSLEDKNKNSNEEINNLLSLLSKKIKMEFVTGTNYEI